MATNPSTPSRQGAVDGVPLLDLKAQYAPIRDEIESVIREVCDSQYFVLGPRVEQFEREVAEYCAVEHAIGMSSGTDALLAALMAIDVGPGDEVVTTPYSFFSTAGVIARLGARAVFCDIDLETYNIDPASVETFLAGCVRDGDVLRNPRTGGIVRALMPVHLFGQVAPMDPLLALARTYGLRVIEDAAQAIGASDDQGRRAGSIGDIGCFSFFPSKNLGAFGDGGLCVSGDPELADRLRILRVHGAEQRYYHATVGGNFRLDALQAAVLSVKLRHLDAWTVGRQSNAAYYTEALGKGSAAGRLVTPTVLPGHRHIFNQYVIRVRDAADAAVRDQLKEHLREQKVGCEVYYPVPLHLQACFADLGYQVGDLPNAEQAASSTLAVPVYAELAREQQDYVITAIDACLSS